MRCPVCRAENDETTCRRCKADLSLLFALEDARQGALAEAARAVGAGDGERAVVQAQAADDLRADAESARLLALGYLLKRDFARALQYYRER
jgi:hypothetical protein